MSVRYDYLHDGAEIYRRSFAIIRAEADLRRFSGPAERVVVRMIHACGMTDLPADVEMSARTSRTPRAEALVPARRSCAIRDGGRTASPAPACPPTTPWCARSPIRGCRSSRPTSATTRTAAAMELWRERLDGAVVAIGNAPTALFHLLEMLGDGAPRPAAVIGIPVGFVGAAESKEALAPTARLPFLVVHGRRGGSAMAAAAVNALASDGGMKPQATSAMRRLFGVGLGPGDPELMTLRAAEGPAPRRPARAYFAKKGRRGNARAIADSVVPAGSGAGDRPRLPGDDRDRRGRPRLCGRHRRRSTTEAAATLAARSGDGRDRRRALRGRSVLLRLLHASVAAAGATRYPDRGGARASPACPAAGRAAGATDRLGRRRADRAARRRCPRRAGRRLRRHRRRRDHEARAATCRRYARVLEQAGLLERAIYVERGTMAERAHLPARREDATTRRPISR